MRHNPPRPRELTEAELLKRLKRSVVKNEDGSPQMVFHGTDANFSEFQKVGGKRSVLFSVIDAPSCGFFFTPNIKDAQSYGRTIIPAYLILNKPLLDRYNHPDYGVERVPPKLHRDLNYILQPVMQQDASGYFIDVGVRRDYMTDRDLKTGDWIYYLIQDGKLIWDALDNCEVVRRMVERGYDGTFVHENDNETDFSIFVVDQSQIIVTRMPEPEYEEDELTYS